MRRGRATIAALLALALLSGCGGSGGDDGAEAARSGTATTPPTATTPGGGYAPPALRSQYGRGPQIGALVRTRHAETTFNTLPPGFSPGGIPVGSRAGLCRVPAPTAEDRAQIEAQAQVQTTDGEVQPIRDEQILLADCGSSGRWALVAWFALDEAGEANVWIDELRYDGDGRWSGTAPGVYPGCRMPLAAAAVWQVDVSRCPPSARRPPSEAPPRRAAPRPLGRLSDGSSRA
ncbi:hypothetical protein VSS74_00520 [Conexibacter stalactiti]|uniref:Ig-like domain-containing protein n=1 Tax=Conexibacter stalactiti TaxID=1940611 RepID=A0ABU4HJE1_9ACTN|nr:hypothetical protein [Conexibacter stalactiti]MDW5592799.1 hypothetical protein [Conexibacter stalactiti]MEC5033440.1 hypothetical protein [Conexibacter stalactiti]